MNKDLNLKKFIVNGPNAADNAEFLVRIFQMIDEDFYTIKWDNAIVTALGSTRKQWFSQE